MARTKPKPEILIRSLTLTTATQETLERLSQNATDYIGRKVSSSAIARALLRHAEQQSASWATSDLFPLIETELASGMVWGKKK